MKGWGWFCVICGLAALLFPPYELRWNVIGAVNLLVGVWMVTDE